MTVCVATVTATRMIVIDASVVLKWVIEEDGSDEAEALLLEEPLAAPDLWSWNVLTFSGRRRGAEC